MTKREPQSGAVERNATALDDGWATHGHRAAFERDRARDAQITALGYVVLRFTWRQLAREPLLVAARLAAVLSPREPGRDRG